MANEKLKQGAQRIDNSSRSFGSMLDKLDTSTKKFRGKRGSIIKSAKGNIFEFPVFVSNSVPLDYAEATSALLEQVYASYLQMAISINPVIDHTMATNGLQFSGLRTDTNKYLEYTDTMWQHDACHAVYDNEDCIVEFNMISYSDTDARVILENVNYQPLEEFDHYFMETHKRSEYDKKHNKGGKGEDDNSNIDPSQFGRGWYGGKKPKNTTQGSDASMDDLKTGESDDKYINPGTSKGSKKVDSTQAAKNDAEIAANEYRNSAKNLNKARQDFNSATNTLKSVEASAKSIEARSKEIDRKYQKLVEREAHANGKEREQLKKEIELTKKEREQLKKDAKDNEIQRQKTEAELKKLNLEISEKMRTSQGGSLDQLKQGELANAARIKASKVLSEKDMEKLNTMKPILMTVDLNVKSDTGTLSPVEYIVGVKTFNRIVDADILPEVVEYPLQKMDKITRKAKWRAGELKFFSDIVFRIKEKKQTAVDAKDPKRKWYRRLYELAHMKGDAQTANIVNGGSVISSFIFDKQGRTKEVHGLVPNVAMVVSKSDVDVIKMQTGIDLLNGKKAAKFCNELFMMAFVVIDVDSESIKLLLPELHNEYDVHSIAAVNRQIASLDSSNKSMKNFFSLMNR